MMSAAACQRLAAASPMLLGGRRAIRSGRPSAQTIVSQARKGLSELLSLGNK